MDTDNRVCRVVVMSTITHSDDDVTQSVHLLHRRSAAKCYIDLFYYNGD